MMYAWWRIRDPKRGRPRTFRAFYHWADRLAHRPRFGGECELVRLDVHLVMGDLVPDGDPMKSGAKRVVLGKGTDRYNTAEIRHASIPEQLINSIVTSKGRDLL